MPFSFKDLTALLNISGATPIVENINEYWTTKSRISFKCKCGTIDENQIRNIKKSGGLCKSCMAVQKSKRISDKNKRKPIDLSQIDLTTHKQCISGKLGKSGCKQYKHISMFESDRIKDDYSKLCLSCRNAPIKSQRKKIN